LRRQHLITSERIKEHPVPKPPLFRRVVSVDSDVDGILCEICHPIVGNTVDQQPVSSISHNVRHPRRNQHESEMK
jgi:hypothetical protein